MTQKKDKRKRAPSLSPASREQYMISIAIGEAERQILDGTASSQIITHYLKLGSERESLERTNLEEKNKLLAAKTEAIESDKTSERLYADAMKMFKVYQGGGADDDDSDI